ncbi:MAG: Asp23/Gls24 family envelope stress response protein [Butyricicoccus sp.]|nr:Asp23/Gls24 family envelope stress response protein [Clostridiales bacterium]MDY5972781.1 Asp23/Gls24 family envelope stress response protein [Butyricicoccus sp.]
MKFMAEHKEYWITAGDQGTIKISEDVVASIAALAATETEGVSGLCTGLKSEIASLLGKKNSSKGVKVQLGDDDTVAVEVNFMAKFGHSVREVAGNVQARVKSEIESMTGLKAAAVNVCVGGVTFDAPKAAEETAPAVVDPEA